MNLHSVLVILPAAAAIKDPITDRTFISVVITRVERHTHSERRKPRRDKVELVRLLFEIFPQSQFLVEWAIFGHGLAELLSVAASIYPSSPDRLDLVSLCVASFYLSSCA